MADNPDNPNQDLQWLMKTLGIHQFLPSTWLMEWLSSEVITNIIVIVAVAVVVDVVVVIVVIVIIMIIKVCDEAMATAAVCRNIIFLISGYNKAEMNSTVGSESCSSNFLS